MFYPFPVPHTGRHWRVTRSRFLWFWLFGWNTPDAKTYIAVTDDHGNLIAPDPAQLSVSLGS